MVMNFKLKWNHHCIHIEIAIADDVEHETLMETKDNNIQEIVSDIQNTVGVDSVPRRSQPSMW